MSLLYTVSFKEFGSLVCFWHDVKLRKTQLEVRSRNVTWRRDLWCQRVIIFFRNVSNCWLNRYGKFGGATRRRFFRYLRKTWGGRLISAPPGRARDKRARIMKRGRRKGTPVNFMVCNFGDLGSIPPRSSEIKPERYVDFSEMTDLRLFRSSARTIIPRIKPKQAFQSFWNALIAKSYQIWSKVNN